MMIFSCFLHRRFMLNTRPYRYTEKGMEPIGKSDGQREYFPESHLKDIEEAKGGGQESGDRRRPWNGSWNMRWASRATQLVFALTPRMESLCCQDSHINPEAQCVCLILPQFRGHPVKPQLSSLRTRPGSHSQGSSDGASDYRTPQCTRRCPVSRLHESRSADGTRARA